MVQRKNGSDGAQLKQAVIFDFDGTIADSLPAVIQVFEELTGRLGQYSLEQADNYRDMSVPELMKALRIPRWKAPLLLMKGRKQLHSHLHGIPLHKGMKVLIKQLHEKGIPLYVLSSNSTENVHSYLRRNDMQKFFNGAYGGASMLGKAPRLLKLIDNEKIDVAHSWYVGDEMRDVSAARAVGLRVASVSWGYNSHAALQTKEPDAIVDTTTELKKVLEASWKKSK